MVPLLWWCLAVPSLLAVDSRAQGSEQLMDNPGVTVISGRKKRNAVHPRRSDKGFEYTNPDFVDGKPLYQKDIMLTPEQWQALRERKAIADLIYRWPAGPDGFPLVPYVTVSPVNVTAVQAGLQHWMDNTCIKFTSTTNTSQPHLVFIVDTGCWSYIGRIYYWNGQNISIGAGCTGLGTVAHEVGHAMGFFHEQSRPDRDTYVNIMFSNVIPGKENNFVKQPQSIVNNYSVPYDYTSVMHYGPTYFTNNGAPTISTVDPFAQGLIGQRSGLSHRDKLLANLMYNCTRKWLVACGNTSDPCQNSGYLGANCTCVCPPGTSGTLCQVVTGGYYGGLLQPCSRTVNTTGIITSPNYPSNYPSGSRCTYVVTAPECYYPKLTFSSFQLYGRNPYCNNNLCCYFDYLEIRTTNTTSGQLYCATDISAGQVFTASVNPMILYFTTASNYFPGWSANVSFVAIPGCSSNSTSTTTTTTPPATIITTPTTTTSPSATTTSSTTTTPTTTTSPTSTTTSSTTTTPTTTTSPTSTTTSSTTTTPTTTTSPTSTTTSSTTTTPTTTTSPTATTTSSTTTTPTTTTTLSTTKTTTTTTPTITTNTATSTSTTPTTTTTRSTTTTTTSTTTTTPPTIKTTTTTSTSTTSTTPTTTIKTTSTTKPSGPTCAITYQNSCFLWTSPYFGVKNYPNNFRCYLFGSSTAPNKVTYIANSFALKTGDSVSITYPYSRTKYYTGTTKWTFSAPNFNFNMAFQSDYLLNAAGFNISICPQQTSCHKLVNTTVVGSQGFYQTTNFWSMVNHSALTQCEWWIVAPAGKVIVVGMYYATLSATGCPLNYVVVNGRGEKTYPAATSSLLCGTGIKTFTSTNNTMYIAYQGQAGQSSGMFFIYNVQ